MVYLCLQRLNTQSVWKALPALPAISGTSFIDALMQRCVEPGKINVGIGGQQPSEATLKAGKAVQQELLLTGKKWIIP